MNKNDCIYVAGHRGLVGSAICRALKTRGFANVWTSTRQEVDLTSREHVKWFFDECRPDYVFLCAAKVGGIQANIDAPADFLTENIEIQTNIMRAAHAFHVRKLLWFGSAAMYPKNGGSPLTVNQLYSGALDETKDGYAVAKLAGLKLAQTMRRQHHCDFVTVIPNNLYGVGDTYHAQHAHVIPAMLMKLHAAKVSGQPPTFWGSGKARREFLFADDLADAAIFVMDSYSGEAPVNAGAGEDLDMRTLAGLAADAVGYTGEIKWDASKPEGTMRRLLSNQFLRALGWSPKVTLREGLQRAYQDYLCQQH